MRTARRVLVFCVLALAPVIAGAGGIAYSPNLSLYLSYSFGAPAGPSQAAYLHYGLRVDHDLGHLFRSKQHPALFEWQFDLSGFDHIAIAGLPIVNSRMVLQAEGDGGLGAYLSEHAGQIIIFGGGALLLGLVVAGSAQASDRDVDDIDVGGNIDCAKHAGAPGVSNCPSRS